MESAALYYKDFTKMLKFDSGSVTLDGKKMRA